MHGRVGVNAPPSRGESRRCPTDVLTSAWPQQRSDICPKVAYRGRVMTRPPRGGTTPGRPTPRVHRRDACRTPRSSRLLRRRAGKPTTRPCLIDRRLLRAPALGNDPAGALPRVVHNRVAATTRCARSARRHFCASSMHGLGPPLVLGCGDTRSATPLAPSSVSRAAGVASPRAALRWWRGEGSGSGGSSRGSRDPGDQP